MQAACKSWPFPNVEIDLEALQREQKARSGSLEKALEISARENSWDEVRAAMAVIERDRDFINHT